MSCLHPPMPRDWRQVAKVSNCRDFSTCMSCAALSLNAVNDVHELPHSPLINRIPGHAVDLETRADDGAVGKAEQFRGVAGAETGVDQYRYTRAGHGLSDVGQSRGFRGL